MAKKFLGITVIAMLMMPVGASGAVRDLTGKPMCVPIPVSTDAKDIHVGGQHHHIAGRTDIKACVTVDEEVQGTPTVTRYDNCGDACFAVRVSDVRAYADVSVALRWKEDGEDNQLVVDPEPIDLTREVDNVCISNHSPGTPDPCVVTILSPGDLKAKGGAKQVTLRWSPAQENYGRSIETTYEVWRNTSEDLETFEQIATSSTTRFVDTGLTKKTTYYYFVVAVDQDGNRSGGSNLASATTN